MHGRNPTKMCEGVHTQTAGCRIVDVKRVVWIDDTKPKRWNGKEGTCVLTAWKWPRGVRKSYTSHVTAEEKKGCGRR